MITIDRGLGSLPVSAGEPCGRDVRYDDAFQSLQQEIDKLGSPVGRASFSWAEVSEQSVLILKNHSKDILAASYLAVALMHIHGATGLETGLWILRDLIVTHWPDLFPSMKRIKGRRAAIEWLTEKTAQAMTEGAVWGLDTECRDAVRDHLRAMDSFLKENGEDGIALMALERMVYGAQTVDSPGPAAAMKEPVPVQPLAPGHTSDLSARPAVPVMPGASEDPSAGMAPVFQALKSASKAMADETLDNPQSYRWLRFAIWEPLKNLPASKDRVTRIPAPATQLVARLETLHGSGDWPELLRSSEAALHSSKHLFYLDLNMFSHEALSNLGPSYENAARSVLSETRNFVSRLSSVETLLFDDRTPFASEKTQAWLESGTEHLRSEGKGPSENSDALSGKIHEDMAWVRETVRKGMKTNEAVALYLQRIHDSGSGQDALLWRLELIVLLASAKREKLASAQIDHVLDAVDRHGLGVWSPGFASHALLAVYKVLKSHPDARRRIKPDDVLVLLAGIDPLSAMDL